MAKRAGRPSKLDKDTMHAANVSFIIIVIILLLLLSIAILSIIPSSTYESIKASVINLFR